MSDNPPPPRYLPRGLTPEAVAELKWLYEKTDEPLTEVAAQFEICRHTLRKVAEAEGWTPRLERPRVGPRPPLPARQARGFSQQALDDLRRRYVETEEPVQRIAEDYHIHRNTLERLAMQEGWPRRKDRPPRDMPVLLQINREATAALQQARAIAAGAPLPGLPPPAVDTEAAAPAPESEAEMAPVPEAASAAEAVTEASAATPADQTSPEAALSLARRLERAVETQLRKVENLREDTTLGGHRAVEAERIARTLAALTQTLFKVRQLRDPERALSAADDEMPADADGFRLELARRIETFVGGGHDRALPASGQPAQPGSVAG
ncbi:hypothetical protein [Rhodopseudomonas palustris]|uniref:hypothetical protein n=1 Tax=Rhodopseudomonas palustris TaxID=1076 RepID=UPI000CECBB14|nr:hypothetical protein [Rhodopseudomonas palustris]PPQ43661.1 hypothetical protein CKO39_10735 [Rhodopseudomonas palustris]